MIQNLNCKVIATLVERNQLPSQNLFIIIWISEFWKFATLVFAMEAQRTFTSGAAQKRKMAKNIP